MLIHTLLLLLTHDGSCVFLGLLVLAA
jgi:hypothetical protein